MGNVINLIIESYSKLYNSRPDAYKSNVRRADAATKGKASGNKFRIVGAAKGKAFSSQLKKLSQEQVPAIVLCEEYPDFAKILSPTSRAAVVTSGEGFDIEQLKVKQISAIGLQRYVTDPKVEIALNKKGFETMHLGEYRDNPANCEPLLREANYIFLDMRSVKWSDYQMEPTEEKSVTQGCNPNGFTADEICQVARYAGFAINLKAVFIHGLPNKEDISCLNLVSQVIWHIADGISANIKEDPKEAFQRKKGSSQYEYKIVELSQEEDTITFVRSLSTKRWWMEVPVVKKNNTELISCSMADYQAACDGQVPFRWLFFYKKLNEM